MSMSLMHYNSVRPATTQPSVGSTFRGRTPGMMSTQRSVANFANINKSLGKLDAIYRSNWSHKD